MEQPLNNKEINAKILEIIEYIQTTESYQNYLKARKILDALIEANKGYWPELKQETVW